MFGYVRLKSEMVVRFRESSILSSMLVCKASEELFSINNVRNIEILFFSFNRYV